MTQILTAYPSEASIFAIAQSYSEYRYAHYQITLVPIASSSTLGNGYIAYQLAPPTTPADLAAVAAQQGFTAGPAFGRNTTSRLDVRGRSRRWFQIQQGALTQANSINPDYVQAWPTVGSSGVQSGVVAWDVYLTFTLQLRGPVAPSTTITPAVTCSLTHSGISSDSALLEDEEE